jgi:aspartate aminotransferase-like enzyme
MEPLAAEPYRSKTVSTINNAKGWVIGDLNKFLLTKGMRIANGYGDLKEKTYRIAHMGEINMKNVDTLLAAMEEFMAK